MLIFGRVHELFCDGLMGVSDWDEMGPESFGGRRQAQADWLINRARANTLRVGSNRFKPNLGNNSQPISPRSPISNPQVQMNAETRLW